MSQVVISRGVDCRQEFMLDEPMTVREWVSRNVGEDFATPMICLYQGQPLLRERWELTTIEAELTFIPLPLGGGGGGKNPLVMIGMVVVMVAAAVVTAGVGSLAAGSGWAWGLGAGGLTGWSAAAGVMAGSAVMMGGSMLVNALFPTRMPTIDTNMRSLESASPTYSLTSSANQARLYQMIPESFGTNDQVPDLAAQAWMEFDSKGDQYLHQLLCVGVGEYQIHSVSIEDTPIWENGKPTNNFPGVEVEIVNPGQPIILFPDTDNVESALEVNGQSLTKAFQAEKAAERYIGPFTVNSAGTEISTIALDIVFPGGLGRMNTQGGGILTHGVSVRFDYRKIDDFGIAQGGWQELFSNYYSSATRTPLRYTHKISTPKITGKVGGVSGQDLGAGTAGPFVTNPVGTKAVELMFDVHFPYGLYMTYVEGESSYTKPHSVTVQFDYRRIGANGKPVSDWSMLRSKTYTSNGMMLYEWRQPFTRTETVPVAGHDRYEVRVYCASQPYSVQLTGMRCTYQTARLSGRYEVRGLCTGGGEDNLYLMNEVVWAGMKAYLPSKKVYPDVTLIAVKARASNSLSQSSASQFHVVHTRKLPKWDPKSGWSAPQATNSWAWAMAAIAKAPWGGRRADRQIDLEALYKLDQELSARGDEFCQVLDTRQSVWGLFTEACRCVRAIPRAILSTISWMRDAPNRPVRGVFTPYNIIRDSFKVDYAFFTEDASDDVVLEYRDRDGWMERDVRAALPDSLSREPVRKRFLGISLRKQAYREACFETACNAYRRVFLSWSTEMEGRLLCRGDMVLVTHPLGGEDHWAGVTGWDEDAATLRLDTTLPWEESSDGYVVLRRPNGTPYGPVAVAGVEDDRLRLNAQSLAELEAAEQAKGHAPIWEWLSNGKSSVATALIFGKETQGVPVIILSVTPRQNGMCDIEAVVEDDRVHQADLGAVPPWTPDGEAGQITVRPEIDDLVAVYNAETSLLTIAWAKSSGAVSYQAQYRSYESWQELDPNDPDGAAWISNSGWSEWNDVEESAALSRSFVVSPVIVEYRVRGLRPEMSGLWRTQQTDCSYVAEPEAGEPEQEVTE